MIVQMMDHLAKARDRLASQFRELPNIDAVLKGFCLKAQDLEAVFFDLMDSRSIVNATGIQLDLWGLLLNKARGGLTDDNLYRITLLAKIAQNVSQGSPEDVMQVFRLLMQAKYVVYYEPPGVPASFQLTAVGANPIGTIQDIKRAVSLSKATGTAIDLLTSTTAQPFGFAGNEDPNVRGFGDLNDSTVGGTFSSII
jgi:hypothetical protein